MSSKVQPITTSKTPPVPLCQYTVFSSDPGCCCLAYFEKSYEQTCAYALDHFRRFMTSNDSLAYPTFKIQYSITSFEPLVEEVPTKDAPTEEAPSDAPINYKPTIIYTSPRVRISDAIVTLAQFISHKALPEKPLRHRKEKRLKPLGPIVTSSEKPVSLCHYTVFSSNPGSNCLGYFRTTWKQTCEFARLHFHQLAHFNDGLVFPTFKIQYTIITYELIQSPLVKAANSEAKQQYRPTAIYKSPEVRVSDALAAITLFLSRNILPKHLPTRMERLRQRFSCLSC